MTNPQFFLTKFSFFFHLNSLAVAVLDYDDDEEGGDEYYDDNTAAGKGESLRIAETFHKLS